MDIFQRKLTKSEWDAIEHPVSAEELATLRLIRDGFTNVDIRQNHTKTLITYLKLTSQDLDSYLFVRYFQPSCATLVTQLSAIVPSGVFSLGPPLVKLRSVDQVRIKQLDAVSDTELSSLYEFVLWKHLTALARGVQASSSHEWTREYYTLHTLLSRHVVAPNHHVVQMCRTVLDQLRAEAATHAVAFAAQASTHVEQNVALFECMDAMLYDHQKELFHVLKQHSQQPKLVLYVAPTGTGKTKSPLGLLVQFRVIYVCAARHVGLDVARSAISLNHRIAFAFNCTQPGDIRLHYFAAKEFTRNKRSGGIGKVDNSAGERVEMMICDVSSYLCAMHYMLAFNAPEHLVLFWDEPTISMDCEQHAMHDVIHANWVGNRIPHVVLSSATLPHRHQLPDVIDDFVRTFSTFECTPLIHEIVSHHCSKSITLIDAHGHAIVLHRLFSSLPLLHRAAKRCEEHPTLLRYLDVHEVGRFVEWWQSHPHFTQRTSWTRTCPTLESITLASLKLFYVHALQLLEDSDWSLLQLFASACESDPPRLPPRSATSTTAFASASASASSGMYVTTWDAHTLTGGPTIYLTDEVTKIATFCVQQSAIPGDVMQTLHDSIQFNSQIADELDKWETELTALEDKLESKLAGKQQTAEDATTKKSMRATQKQVAAASSHKLEHNQAAKTLRDRISDCSKLIRRVALHDIYVPNTLAHQHQWAPAVASSLRPPFQSQVDENTVKKIMALSHIPDRWKLLLLLGIGVFSGQVVGTYIDIIKQLADEQKLYLIVADSDYIYGTNYSFCHGYIGKDLTLTQDKIVQALGRIGRGHVRGCYTARFRNSQHAQLLFLPQTTTREIETMNRLFCTPPDV